jgi:hypothetical protein
MELHVLTQLYPRRTWGVLEKSRFGYSTEFKRQLEDETTVICAYIEWVETLQLLFRRASRVEMCAQAAVDLLGTFCQLQIFVI